MACDPGNNHDTAEALTRAATAFSVYAYLEVTSALVFPLVPTEVGHRPPTLAPLSVVPLVGDSMNLC